VTDNRELKIEPCGGADQGAHLRIQVLGDEYRARTAVLGVVAQFAVQVHRIDRHHDRAGPQNAVVRHDPLRAVLHVQQYAVAGLDAALALQETGNPLRFVLELREADGSVS
jgi:hypothetical protein